MYRVADRDRTIELDLQIDRGRHLRPVGRQALAHGIDHVDRIGAGLALNRKRDRPTFVEPVRLLVVLDAVDDAGDLLQLDRGAIAPRHHHIFVFLGAPHGGGRKQSDVLARAVERTDGRVGIGRDQHAADLVERNVARSRRHRIDLHPDREFLRPIDLDLRDARNLRHLLRQDHLGIVVDRRQRQGR